MTTHGTHSVMPGSVNEYTDTIWKIIKVHNCVAVVFVYVCMCLHLCQITGLWTMLLMNFHKGMLISTTSKVFQFYHKLACLCSDFVEFSEEKRFASNYIMTWLVLNSMMRFVECSLS